MTAPTVAVTVTLDKSDGENVAGVLVRARLDGNEVYQGIVISNLVEAVTDSEGVAVLDLFPNAPSPSGLGTQGTTYRFTAAVPNGRGLNVNARVPNSDCRLENILVGDEVGSLTDAELALSQAQAAVTTAAASAAAAAADAVQTAADRVQTGEDRVATAADRVQTGLDRTATAADRVQTGLDADSAAQSAAEAETIVLGDFLQGGTGAVARTFPDKVREEALTDTDFGADSSGVADALEGMQDAHARSAAVALSGISGVVGDGVYVGTSPVVKLPYGARSVSDSITPDTDQAVNYTRVAGESTVLVAADDTVVFYGGLGYQTWHEWVTFRGGDVALSYKTANVDSTQGGASHCEFHRQKTACIQTDGTSNSSILDFTHCKFMQDVSTNGYVGNFSSGDFVKFDTCWVMCNTPVAFENNGNLTLRDCIGVDGADLERWIDNYHAVEVDNFLFGGHNSGKAMVRNYADTLTDSTNSTRVSIRNTEAFSSGYLIELYKLPNIINLENLKGVTSPQNIFYVDSALDSDDFYNWQRFGQLNISGLWTGIYGPSLQSLSTTVSTAGDIVRKLFLASLIRSGQIAPPRGVRAKVADILGSGEQGGGWTVVASNCGEAFADDAYGVQQAVLTASADEGELSSTLTGYLDESVLTYGDCYTLHQFVDVEADDGADVTLDIGGARKLFHLAKGKHVLALPFVYLNDTGSASATRDSYAWTVQIRRNGEVVNVGRHLLTKGFAQYDGPVLTLEGTAAPAAYTVGTTYDAGYFVGDLNYRTNVAAAGAPGDACTTAGAPGTWKAMASVAA